MAQWNLQCQSPRTAADGGPRPASAGKALDRAPPHQSVASVAAHLTAGPQRAPVGSAPRGVAGHLPIGQTWRMTPVWVCVSNIDYVSVISRAAELVCEAKTLLSTCGVDMKQVWVLHLAAGDRRFDSSMPPSTLVSGADNTDKILD